MPQAVDNLLTISTDGHFQGNAALTVVPADRALGSPLVHYSGRVSSTQPPLERPDEVRAKAHEFEKNLSAPWPVAQPAPEGAHAGNKGRRLKLKNPGRSPPRAHQSSEASESRLGRTPRQRGKAAEETTAFATIEAKRDGWLQTSDSVWSLTTASFSSWTARRI
jgi:hypothetical protein